ncbi:hypothetical protein Pint_20339 [Pistacia integerrima]|uniref:Uncharacterized protein n=1 Tax=Pistacia integerrima TaxID=434235 RepID=A0ACC0XD93_9ROSI|nr:hypothetical protein Pint_20339 [Pistacia integerrima]
MSSSSFTDSLEQKDVVRGKIFSEDVKKSGSSNMGNELSQSEPPSMETIVKGFLKRATEDPEVPKLKITFELYMEKYGTSLGFSYSLSVPKKKRSEKKKRSDSSNSSTEYRTDESSQSEPPRQPVLEVEVEPPMPERFRAIVGRMCGSDIGFVIEKALTETDLQQQSNLLSLPRKQVKTDSFLTNEEKDILDAKEQNGIGVILVTPCEKSVILKLKKWRMSKDFVYAIIGAWFKEVVDYADN